MKTRQNIAVLGAGFGGLRAAKVLEKKLRKLGLGDAYQILLIDKNEHHTFTPLLYEIATTSKEIASLYDLHRIAAYNIKDLTRHTSIQFIRKEVDRIDSLTGSIYFTDGASLACRYIVLSLGSEPNYFNIPGLKEQALPFKTFLDAVKIRDTVWNLKLEKPKEIRVVVGGGGSTGVELAAEFRNLSGRAQKELQGCILSVLLVEARENILVGFDRRIIEMTRRRLEQLGVNLITGKKVSKVENSALVLENGEKVLFDIFIWTGGVKAPALLTRMPIQTETQDRAVVGEGMECLPQTPDLKLTARVYGLGDSICFYDAVTKKPNPGVARAAISQANVAAHNITEEIKQSEFRSYNLKLKTYKPIEYPYIIPIGGKFAVAKVGPFVVTGFLGWILKCLVELNYLLATLPISKAIQVWLKNLGIFIRNARLG